MRSRIVIVQAVTASRVVAALVFAAFALTPAAYAIAVCAYLIGLFSDILDGVLARALRVATQAGGAFDGFADKALSVVSVLYLVANMAPLLPCLLILVRDTFVLSLRAFDSHLVPPSRLKGALSGFFVRIATLYVLLLHGRPDTLKLLIFVWVGATVSFALLSHDLWKSRNGILRIGTQFRRAAKHERQ